MIKKLDNYDKERRKNMKKRLFKIFTLVLSLTLILMSSLFLGACLDTTETSDDIVILYTNDVHCGITNDLGYAGVAAYKKNWETKTDYVTLVDAGDAIQGDFIGAVSQGEYIVDIMNEIGYDFAVLGNHEFDYGMDQLEYLIDKANATYLGCNINYTGTGTNKLSEVKPYEIVKYGDVSVGYLGVSTPYSVTSSTPAYFQENGEFVYNFTGPTLVGKTLEESFNALIQANIDECLQNGADYIVVLAHLGDGDVFTPYSSVNLVNNTTGIDVVIDGHAHSEIDCRIENDQAGNEVIITSTGTKLNNLGQLVITGSGNITTSLINHYSEKDAATANYLDTIQTEYEAKRNEVVATSNTTLSVNNSEGYRIVRNRETTIGDFCADAYRNIAGADVAFVNGGGIRADLKAGNITYGDIINVHPYGNTLCMVYATGQEIIDALEMGSRKTESAIAGADGWSVGETGSFLQVSGIKYTIDTSITSTVELDANNLFVGVTGERRVKDVYILNENGNYEPIDLTKTYKVASHNYMIKNGGDGYTMFKDNQLLIDEAMLDYQMLITYLVDELKGDLSRYATTNGRITIK